MSSKDIIKKILEKWNFAILSESDSAILTRYQMSYVNIGSLRGDITSVAVSLAGAYSVHNETERRISLNVCNHLNGDLMQVKAYIDGDDDVVFASEFFYKSESDVEFLLETALSLVITAKTAFGRKYAEASKAEDHYRELN